MNFSDIVKERAAVNAEAEKRKKHYEDFVAGSKARLQQLAEAEALLRGGIDVERRARGLAVIAVRGSVTCRCGSDRSRRRAAPLRIGAVNDAKIDIANGAKRLRAEYFGVKNYEHFGDQREDHSYGMGPKHGSIVFSVGLRHDVFERLRSGGELAPVEIEDALYVLATLDKAEELRQSVQITVTIELQELCEKLDLEQFLDDAVAVTVTQADDQDGKVTITFAPC